MRNEPRSPTKKIDIRELGPDSAEELVALHRRSFPADTVERSIFGCSGVATYLRHLLSCPPAVRSDRFHGAQIGGKLVGYSQVRDAADSLHLNQIAVDPRHRGFAVGSILVNRWIVEARSRPSRRLTLDVELSNAAARDWYFRLGFQEEARKWLYVMSPAPVAPNAGRPTVRVPDWPVAEAVFASFGFCEFTVVRGEHTWRVGRLGERWLSLRWPVPMWLMVQLGELFPGSRLLITSDTPITEAGASLVATVLRLAKSLR